MLKMLRSVLCPLANIEIYSNEKFDKLNNSKAIDLIIIFHLVSKAATCTDQTVLLGIVRTI